MTFPLGDTTRFRHEFDWTGTRDMSAHCALPFAIGYLADEVEGGWPAIMQHNHDLAVRGRAILCESLGLVPPCPDDMVACIATLILPEADSGGVAVHNLVFPTRVAPPQIESERVLRNGLVARMARHVPRVAVAAVSHVARSFEQPRARL